MQITYTAPNRSHHYPYADALHRAGHLYAFVCGFSRLSPRSRLDSIGVKLKRYDFFQNLYLASLKFKSPAVFSDTLDRISSYRLDQASYLWAKESDVFIYYRTKGHNTTQRIHRNGLATLCVMEEVNSHVDYCHSLLREELRRLGIADQQEKFSDHALRLKAYEEADCVLCPSEFVRRSFLAKGFAPERLMVVNFGFPHIETGIVSPSVLANKSFRVLYVGQLHYRKGLRYAIEAFRQLKHPNKKFVIVGSKTPITGLEKTQVPEGVIFTGPLKDEALKEQYRQANVFILPSLEEGLALVQGEALSFGVPLLITTNTGGDDIIKDGVEGFIVPPADAKALAERLQQMADDKELRTHMATAALQAARNLGSWDVAARNLITELKTVLSRRS